MYTLMKWERMEKVMINLFLYFAILHILADFHLQSNKMFENKSSSFSWLIAHISVHAIVFGMFAFMFDGEAWIYVAAMVFVHFILELMKAIIIQCEFKGVCNRLELVEVISQLVHFGVLYAFSSYFFRHQFFLEITQMHTVFGMDATVGLSVVVAVLMLTRPVHVLFKIKKGSLELVNI
ncbi:DUF3307 domain-containing protein [Erysipelothrix rhusiopathiae]|nr:DUF3307 domain-containing protein [Erysipelothrix rhusiopathiae]MDV7677798.1 DUF3307 domain-containing protein [Erysipelothrix rhusiopathiae]MDV7679656.1 DUF3307 domain-containing protein [Erysipelothrix rhusiopathiae]MDV7681050.1 DUF3307 domain-containing protein [Erysipelothrix rhusiopathiae]MDV7683642.1 DUF3307 domain-containing protein [Erysipelothrix rhusiopathiae]